MAIDLTKYDDYKLCRYVKKQYGLSDTHSAAILRHTLAILRDDLLRDKGRPKP